jgi:hypothetical protein
MSKVDRTEQMMLTHHTIVKRMLYEHSRLALGYVLYAIPIFAFVARDEEVAIENVMVCNILEENKVDE